MNAEALPQTHLRLPRVGMFAAIGAGVALLAKVALIVATANRVNAVIPGVLFAIGMLLPLVAAVGVASYVGGGWLRRIGAFLAVLFVHAMYIMTFSDAIGALVEQFTAEAYLTDEVPVAVAGLLWLIVGLVLRRRLDPATR